MVLCFLLRLRGSATSPVIIAPRLANTNALPKANSKITDSPPNTSERTDNTFLVVDISSAGEVACFLNFFRIDISFNHLCQVSFLSAG